MKNKLKSFTLIELLIVIFIIGVLVTVVVINIAKSATKARDAKRRDTVKTLVDAFEMVTLKYGEGNVSFSNVLNCASGGGGSGLGWVSLTDPPDAVYRTKSIAQCLVDNGFLSTVPYHPNYEANTYAGKLGYLVTETYNNKKSSGDVLNDMKDGFCVGTKLESPSETDKATCTNAATANILGGWVGTWKNICVSQSTAAYTPMNYVMCRVYE